MRFVSFFLAIATAFLMFVSSFTYASEHSFLNHEVIGFSKLRHTTLQVKDMDSHIEWCRTDKDRALRYGFVAVFYYDTDVGGLVYVDGFEISERHITPYWEWDFMVPYLDYDNLLALFHDLVSHAPSCPALDN
jgi:hypothetical protein